MGRMKRTLTLLTLAASAAAILPATASARSSYCSKSGDVCYGVVPNTIPAKLQITTAARYFAKYRLCIASANGQRECHRFKMRKGSAGTYYSTVSVPAHFQFLGRGKYRATWYAGGSKLGPAVSF
jgi:hypothetical protein